MATVTIYYSREDQKYGDWDLYLIPGNQNTSGLLFPDEEIESYYSDYPRKKMSFSIAGTLGYVNIDTNTAQKCGFYIKRKDGYMDYSGNLSIGEPDYEDYYSKIKNAIKKNKTVNSLEHQQQKEYLEIQKILNGVK